MHKMEFCQAYCKDLLKRITKKFILYFFKSYSIYYEFVKFIRIPGIKIEKGNLKKKGTVMGQILARGLTAWPSPSSQMAQGIGVTVRTERGHRTRTHSRQRGGVLATGAAMTR
jgi:hypothetical protein